jgi:hypothetical protein
MHARTSAAATVCLAAAVSLCLPAPTATAASGTFSYTFLTRQGPLTSVLTDPPSGQCLVLPEVIGPRGRPAAYSPHNDTGERATVFVGPDCGGGYARLPPHSRRAPDEVVLRSVWFG